eukprot:TRINITY_DN317_c0_g1_i2.p1 TRINITY_DN317_c0_g1~~TRINITY_DN317_c0_g1_i2.p1  ORF type:complete len:226 (-),score=13.72 TRINITY_DN317_c0_g1_i2:329-1006(-)
MFLRVVSPPVSWLLKMPMKIIIPTHQLLLTFSKMSLVIISLSNFTYSNPLHSAKNGLCSHALSFLDSRAIQLGKPCAFYGSLGVVASMCSITLLYPLHISVYQTLLISLGFLCSLSLWSALSEFNLKKLEYDVYTWERKREKWECDNFIEGERKEMIEIYQNKGLSREDAEKVIRTLSSNTELFVDLMMVEELGIMPIHNRVSSQVFGETPCSFLVCLSYRTVES